MPAATRSGTRASNGQGKKPFDIDDMVLRLRSAVAPYPKAALFELAADGFSSVFEVLAACIISIRTYDEVTIPTARALFAAARTPREAARLPVAEVDRLIRACTFHEAKARQIHDVAVAAVERFDGRLPCDYDVLTGFRGVGPKCANLVLGIACDQPRGIGVDVHVHRVTNRWGYVRAPTPDRTMAALEARLPRPYWTEINALLVPFGKHVCTLRRPRCPTCPLLPYCRQVGVVDPGAPGRDD